MKEKVVQFDAPGFYQALDATRQARRLTWKDVAQASGVSASSLTRMAQGRRPDVDSLAALATWAVLDTDRFLRHNKAKAQPETLAVISSHLRSDRHLTPEAATALDSLIKATYERLRRAK
jgi:transcriptional regulator with XRE-family HTH domain